MRRDRKDKISPFVILRMPRYLRYFEHLASIGVDRISSGDLGEMMGSTPSQIRHDFSHFGEFGQQGYGYNVSMLRQEIIEILGANQTRRIAVIGAGNLGRAMIVNFPFEQYGFNLTEIFDIAPDLVGQKINEITVCHIDEMEKKFQKTPPDVAVLAISADSANDMAWRLAKLGVRGIWNFTNIDLTLQDTNVFVENIHFSDSLLTLSYYMTQKPGETK